MGCEDEDEERFRGKWEDWIWGLDWITTFFYDDEGSTSSFTWYLELITQDTLFDVIWEKRAESYHFFLTHLETEGSERTGSGGRTR